MNRPVMTIRQAAEYAHVTRRTVTNWVKRGLVEYALTPTGQVRIYAESLLKHDATRTDRSGTPACPPDAGGERPGD